MITDLLLNMLYVLLSGIASILPVSATISPNVASSFSTMAVYWNRADVFVPMDIRFVIIVLILAIETGILGYKLINWAINKLRGSG